MCGAARGTSGSGNNNGSSGGQDARLWGRVDQHAQRVRCAQRLYARLPELAHHLLVLSERDQRAVHWCVARAMDIAVRACADLRASSFCLSQVSYNGWTFTGNGGFRKPVQTGVNVGQAFPAEASNDEHGVRNVPSIYL